MGNNLSTKKLLRFSDPFPPVEATRGEGILDLVSQAADLVRDLEARANDNAKYAQTLAERAAQKLRAAEERIQQLESEQRTAQDKIDEALILAAKAAEALNLEQAHARAAEEKVRQLELYVRNAEARASGSEDAVAQVEDAIRTQLLGHGAAA